MLLLPALVTASCFSQGGAISAIQLGDRREIFVDTAIIQELNGVQWSRGIPEDEGAVFSFDQAWEGPFSGYSTVIHDEGKYFLYYRGLPKAGGDGTNQETTCLAVSDDGIAWERPELGLFEVDGSKENNVVLAGSAPFSHNFSPFLDLREACPPSERWKAVAGNEQTGLCAFLSEDGIHWRKQSDQPIIQAGMFDSQNVAFWSESEQLYVCYFRIWTGEGYSGFRSVARTTSRDFIHWTDPVPMQVRGAPMEHLYTNQTHPYFRAPHIYIGLAARFMPQRQVLTESQASAIGVNPRYFRDCSDAVLLATRGDSVYERVIQGGFLRPGIGPENWVSRSNYPACGVVQTSPTEMSFYVNQNYAQATAELRRYSLRLDGFASLSAGVQGGELVTKWLQFDGDSLSLNFSTSAAGEIRVELQGANGEPLPGFSLDECVPIIGNEIDRAVAWSSGASLGDYAGQVVRLRVTLCDADLYAIQFLDRSSDSGE